MHKESKNSIKLINLSILFSLFVILLIHSSCVILPVSSGSNSSGVVSELDVEMLEPGKSTREDVLLLLGSPSISEEEDRFFIYSWVISYVAGTYYAANDFDAEHYFCIEFDETNHIKRHTFCVTRWGKDRWVSKVSEDRHVSLVTD